MRYTRQHLTGVSDEQIAESPAILEYPFDALSESFKELMHQQITWISFDYWHTIAYNQMVWNVKRDSFKTISHWMMFDMQDSGVSFDGMFPVVEETWRVVDNSPIKRLQSLEQFKSCLHGKIAFTGILAKRQLGGELEWQIDRSSAGFDTNPSSIVTRNGYRHKVKDKFYPVVSEDFTRDDIRTRFKTQ